MFNFLKKRKNILQTFLVLALVAVVLYPAVTHGQEENGFGIGDFIGAITGIGYDPLAVGATVAGNAFLNEVSAWAASLLLTFGGWILWAGGSMLDVVVIKTIVGMSEWVGPGPDNLGQVINQTWTAFRDLANMGFIFILLYIAIGTITGLGDVNMKKMLSRVIIVALLINFSLFFTKLLVDTSNIGSVVFYNAIMADPVNQGAEGISSPFMAKLGITGLWSAETAKNVIQGGQNDAPKNSATKMLTLGIFGFIFMLVAAFVFFAFAILLIIRFVIIVFLFILSPLAFAAMALPKDKYSGQWWGALWDQIIFTPVCFALLWVVLKMLEVISPTGADVTTLGVALVGENGKAAVGGGGMIMNFAIIIVFTVAALIIAKKLGASGSSSMLKLGKKLRMGAQGYVGGATFGGLGYLGRRSVGWTGRKIVDSERLKEGQAAGGLKGAIYGAIRGGAKKTAGASFDARASKIGGELAGVVGGVGKAGGKGGYDKYVEANQKRALDLAKDLGPSKTLIDQNEQKLSRVQDREKAIRDQYQVQMNLVGDQQKVIEKSLEPTKKRLEEIKKKRLENLEKLKDGSISAIARTNIQKNIDDAGKEINTLTNKLNIDSIPLGKIKGEGNKIKAQMDSEIDVVRKESESIKKEIDNLKGVSEEEATKRVKAERKQLGESDEEIKAFMKTMDAKKAIDGIKKDSTSKRRAMSYASESVEKPWRKSFRLYLNKKAAQENRPLFAGTRYDEAQKIRSEFSKSKEDQNWEKLIGAVGKKELEGVEKPKKKEDGGDDE